MAKGKIIIISAPSGCGKSTIIGDLIKKEDLNLEFSISATTREPRRGEVDGKDYYFLTLDEFKKAIKKDELVEYEEVYEGRFYGTLKKEIVRIQEDGKNVILDVDVKGGVNVKQLFGNSALSIFIQPPSVDILRHRLLSRGTDSIEAINQRVEKATYELAFASRFDKIIVNDILRDAIDETYRIIKEFVTESNLE